MPYAIFYASARFTLGGSDMQCRHLAPVTLALALSLCSGLASAAGNVALGSSVSLTGTDFGDSGGWCCGSLAAPSTVTDGALLPINQQWNIDTVFWTALALDADTITVTLPTPAIVSRIDLQADNNDDYGIRYRDVGGSWHDLAVISPNRSAGMEMGSANFADITATAFAIYAAGGDYFYSVSEFQAIGTAVPEPATYALMLLGLMCVGAITLRRNSL